MNIPENVVQLAELLHNICCTMNHTDQCAWYYENQEGTTHKHFEACATKLIDQFGFTTICDILVKIRKIRFGNDINDI